MEIMSSDEAHPLKARNCHHVPHIQQLHNWDCGLACTLMVLQSQRLAQRVTLQDLQSQCGTKSVWTVDLAHLLAKYGQQVTFLTVTVGAPNPAYAKESFYKSSISDDTTRVLRLFQELSQAGITVQQRSIRWQELRDWVTTGDTIAIVLVDKLKLRSLQDSNLLACCCGLVQLGYAGHYIVVYGYDSALSEFLVQDPAASRSDIRVSADTLDMARLSFGTDEDILLVSTACREPVKLLDTH